MNQTKGFTLIELLVVISIISLLSSVVTSTLNTARSKARDSRRIQDMKQVALALELYRDSSGAYPTIGASRDSSCYTGGGLGVAVGQWDVALAPVIAAGFLPYAPDDPQNNGAPDASIMPNFCYVYYSGNNTSTFDACRDKQSGALLYPRDYEYFLLFSVENPANVRYTLHWNGLTPFPQNACLPGPSR